MSTNLAVALFNFVTEFKALPRNVTQFSNFTGVTWILSRRFLIALNNADFITVEWVLQNLAPESNDDTNETDANNNAGGDENDAKADDAADDTKEQVTVTRREISAMSNTDASRFFDAVDTMLVNKAGAGTSEFYRLASYHGSPPPNYCHHGQETFPGWHRIYMREFELALQVADKENGNDGNISLPYWDWTTNNSGLPAIIRERFNIWPAGFWPSNVSPRFPLRRASDAQIAAGIRGSRVPADAFNSLKATQHWAHASTATTSRMYPSLEQPHNSMHVIVGGSGGTMSSVAWAAYDIIFWLHHCNVDRIYESYLRIEPDSAAEFENFQETQRVDLFEVDFRPFIDKKTGQFYRAKDTFKTLDLAYVYDELIPEQPLQLREPPTLCILPGIKVSDYGSKCFLVHVYIIDAAAEDEWKDPGTEDEIDVDSVNYAGGQGIFGRGNECENCIIAGPYDLTFDITSTIRALGISRYNARAKVYAVDVTDDTPQVLRLDQTPLPQPYITGPLFEDAQTDLDQAQRQNNNKNEVQQLQRYLQRFGYYASSSPVDGDYGPVTEQAVRDYQAATDLEVTGVVNAATKMSFVVKKRCSNLDPFAKNDERDTDSAGTGYGGRKELTYYIGTHPGYLSRDDVEKAVDTAIEVWSAACGLTFVQVQDDFSKVGVKADIRFNWTTGGRGDNVLAFDGVGGVLGHGGTDENGENGFVEFDISERWVSGLNDGDDERLSSVEDTKTWYRGQPLISLYFTCLHELGHALGLDHSMSGEDVMAPYYNPKLKKLSKGDVTRIQNLYGPPSSDNVNENVNSSN